MSPGISMDLKEVFITQKENEHKGTLGVYSKIPREHLDWRPVDGLLSLGQLARHVWMSELGHRRMALEGDWSYYETRVPKGLFAILGEVKSLDEELEQIDRVHQETMRAAKDLPIDRWDEIRDNAQWNVRLPISVLLFRIIDHQIHHRAQVGTYLRVLTGQRASPYAL